jgi:hypothetical protein
MLYLDFWFVKALIESGNKCASVSQETLAMGGLFFMYDIHNTASSAASQIP